MGYPLRAVSLLLLLLLSTSNSIAATISSHPALQQPSNENIQFAFPSQNLTRPGLLNASHIYPAPTHYTESVRIDVNWEIALSPSPDPRIRREYDVLGTLIRAQHDMMAECILQADGALKRKIPRNDIRFKNQQTLVYLDNPGFDMMGVDGLTYGLMSEVLDTLAQWVMRSGKRDTIFMVVELASGYSVSNGGIRYDQS